MIKKELIKLEDIIFSYDDKFNILDGFSFSLYEKEKIALMAPNGKGKSTFFYLIMGLLDKMPQKGSIKIFGKSMKKEDDFKDTRKKISFLFQNADDYLFCPTVIEDLTFAPLNLGASKDEATKIAKNLLRKFDIEHLENKLIFKLSGGQKRLISIAAAFSLGADLMLLDEPTAGLDDFSKKKVQKILQETKKTFILISHDLDFVKSITDKIYTIKDGKVLTNQDVYRHIHPHFHPKGTSHDHSH